MSKSKTLISIFFIPLTLTFLSSSLVASEHSRYYKSISATSLGLHEEKLTHLHFFFHDIASGPKPTAVRIAEAQITNKSSTLFGRVMAIDDPLTVGPEPGSKLVGKAQGIYAFASQEELALLMAMNFAFMEGKFNGSTLSLLGRNAVLSAVREMPIVGGSGLFRFARGYAQVKTHWINSTTGDAVLEYNVYAFHY